MKTPPPQLSVRCARHGFSLVEIMVAVALLGVIIVGLLAMFYQVQRAFRAGTAQADILEGGRAAMNLIVRDLQEVTACRFDGVTNFVVVPSLNSSITYQDLPTGSQRTNYLNDISFMTRLNDEWVGISYRISNAVSGVGMLYRVVESTNRLTLRDPAFMAISNVSWIVSQTSYDGSRVLDGVVHFSITPCDTNGVSFLTYPDEDTPRLRFIRNREFYAFMSDRLPAYIDIELAILEPSALTKFRAREEIPGPQALDYLKRQVGRTQVFRQRVAIRPAATEIAIR